MDTLTLENIHTLQIDMTSYCNSFCGACIRNINGGPVNPLMTLAHLSWDAWKKICNFCVNYDIKKIIFNGNFGDLSNHPDIVEMLEYLYSIKNNIVLSIHTNGGARTVEFWKHLSSIVKNFSGSRIYFSIDGLVDTNHIYRRGVNFEKIVQNAEAVISEGAVAVWRMIVFDYNLKQIEQASNLAKQMNFSAFNLNRSYNNNIKVIKYKNMPDATITAPSIEIVNRLKEKYEWYNSSIITRDRLEMINSVCPWQRDLKLQINHIGEVWPCCYFSMHNTLRDRSKFLWLDDTLKKYKKNFNNLTYYDFEDIIKHDFFQKNLKDNFKNRKLVYCIEKCGI